MPRGYMEGPASEEREAELERLERAGPPPPEERPAVFGSTEDDPEKHFIGWLDDVDPDSSSPPARRGASRSYAARSKETCRTDPQGAGPAVRVAQVTLRTPCMIVLCGSQMKRYVPRFGA